MKYSGEIHKSLISLVKNQNKQNFMVKLILFGVIKVKGGRCHGNNLFSYTVIICCFVARKNQKSVVMTIVKF